VQVIVVTNTDDDNEGNIHFAIDTGTTVATTAVATFFYVLAKYVV